MIELDEAQRRWRERITVLDSCEVPLADALGRVLRVPLRSRWPLPVHDHAAMDGYALRSADTPAQLTVVGTSAPGHPFTGTLAPGQTVRILTGASIPAGADAVIRQEDIERSGDRLVVREAVPTGHNIRRRGEDIDADVELVAAGTVIDPDVIMALASFGCDPVLVSRTPRVAIVSCGDELVPVAAASPTHVVDIAAPTLAACCRAGGAVAQCFGPARDEPASLRAVIEQARAAAPDLLITIGGASVGDRDLAAPVLDELGIDWSFARVAIKPGKPTGFGLLGALPVFVLPGNPGAARVMFEQFVAPALAVMQGRSEPDTRRAATLALPITRDPRRTTVIQVESSEQGGRLFVDGTQPSSAARLTPRLRANASLLVPPGPEPLPIGTPVELSLRRPPARRRSPPLLAFIGLSNSGKTTLLAALVERLSVDLNVAVIKHGRHFQLDKPGKDSDRFRAAGARVVLVASPELTAVLDHRGREPNFAELLTRLPGSLDLVLVEGFKSEGLPSIEVHRDDRPLLCSEPGFDHVIALVTNNPTLAPAKLPRYAPDELAALEQLVRARL